MRKHDHGQLPSGLSKLSGNSLKKYNKKGEYSLKINENSESSVRDNENNSMVISECGLDLSTSRADSSNLKYIENLSRSVEDEDEMEDYEDEEEEEDDEESIEEEEDEDDFDSNSNEKDTADLDDELKENSASYQEANECQKYLSKNKSILLSSWAFINIDNHIWD